MVKFNDIVKIALVGKYVSRNSDKIFEDAYASVVKALHHAALHCGKKLKIEVRITIILFST